VNLNKRKITLSRLSVILLFMSVIFLLLNSLLLYMGKYHNEWIEMVFSRKIYQTIADFLARINRLFSFSLGEIIVVFFAGIILLLLGVCIKYLMIHDINKAIKYFVWFVVILCWNTMYFQINFGINNYRYSVETLFGFDEVIIQNGEIEEVYIYLINKANEAKEETLHYDLSENNSMKVKPTVDEILASAYLGYEQLGREYPFISTQKVRVKPLLISPLFSSSGYTGIYLYFIGEPTVNSMVPLFSLGFIASHEIAHQKGFSSEDEANFVGFLSCLRHENPWFRYSGYEAMMTYVGNSLYKVDQERYIQLSQLRSQAVLIDQQSERQFWDKHIVETNKELHNSINDSFLKANNQPEGIISYSRVTELIIKAYKVGVF